LSTAGTLNVQLRYSASQSSRKSNIGLSAEVQPQKSFMSSQKYLFRGPSPASLSACLDRCLDPFSSFCDEEGGCWLGYAPRWVAIASHIYKLISFLAHLF